MIDILYYDNQYIKQIRTEIIDIKEIDGEYYVKLKECIFFEGGGGQHSDVGTVNDMDVLRILNDGVVVLSKRPINKEAICKIDWEHRIDGMTSHLAQHIISGCFFSKYNINTAGIHLGKNINTVDLIGEVSKEKIEVIEKLANKVIMENRKVEFFNVSREKAKSMGLRRKLATKDSEIRIVKIQDLDINACCGLHPNSTIEVQIIKIKGIEKNKGNTRIQFLAGNRAVEELLLKDRKSTRLNSSH